MAVLFPALSGFHRHLGVVLGDRGQITGFFRKDRGKLRAIAYCVLGALYLFVVYYSRQSHVFGAPSNYLYLEVGGSLLCFCYAANALVRFRGTHDRTALILAFGFVLSGMIETIGYFSLNGGLHESAAALAHIPLGWMVSRTLLAVLLLAALAVERFMPTARQPSKEIAGVLLVVALAAYATSAAFLAAPAAPVPQALQIISPPWDLLPAGLFLFAAIAFPSRSRKEKNGSCPAPPC